MQQEKPNSSADKLRRHGRKPNYSVPKADIHPEVHTVNISDASPEQQKAYRDLMYKGKTPDTSSVDVGTADSNGRVFIVDPALEKRRRLSSVFESVTLVVMVATVAAIAVFSGISHLSKQKENKPASTEVNAYASANDEITVSFGKFEGFITVGDSLKDAVELMGLPDNYRDGKYFYGNSYLITENDIITGYYKDKTEDFRITVGFKESEEPLVKGDYAPQVAKKLGSPDYCSKNEWIYENIGDNFSTHSYYAKKYGKLTLTFDDNYILSGYIFQEHQQGN